MSASDRIDPECLAYGYAGQVLRRAVHMGIAAHHAQQLADLIASALLAFRVDARLSVCPLDRPEPTPRTVQPVHSPSPSPSGAGRRGEP